MSQDFSRRRIWTILGVIVIMIVTGSFFYDRPSPEAYAYRSEITNVTPDMVSTILGAPEQAKAKLVFIFTSWCPYCKKQLPSILELAQDYSPDQVEFVFLSVERDILKLSGYMGEHYADNPHPPYFLLTESHEPFAEAMLALGSQFRGGIPHILLLAKSGKMVAEFGGIVDKATLTDTLNSMLVDS